MSRGREAALVAALAVVTTVVRTYPLAFQLGSGGRVDAEDGLFSIWSIAWVARTVVADPTELFHANIFYPHRNALAFSEANLLPAQPAFADMEPNHPPVAAAVCGELLSLPLYPSLTEAAVTRVVGAVASSNLGVVP
jgi:hypothetical protein